MFYLLYLKYVFFNGNIVCSCNVCDVDWIRYLVWIILKVFFFLGYNFNKKVFFGKLLFVSGVLKC